jgi:uncharacterized membrane protein
VNYPRDAGDRSVGARTRIPIALHVAYLNHRHMPELEPGNTRYLLVDALRGAAIVLMVVFHFCFDLAYLELADFDFYRDPFWLNLRTVILSMFLGLVGVSLVLATRSGLDRKRYLKRLTLLVVSALAISLSTWWMFGARFVFFGVLHFITVASVLGLLFLRFEWMNLLLGIGLIGFAGNNSFSWFDQVGWRWIGLMTHKPATEDYVPLLPWFGVVLMGMFTAKRLLRLAWMQRLEHSLHDKRLVRILAFSGQRSLWIYLVHQPLLIGLLSVYVRLAP